MNKVKDRTTHHICDDLYVFPSQKHLDKTFKSTHMFKSDHEYKEGPITLAVYVECPGGCYCGEQLAGGELYKCFSCGGKGVAAMGVGFGYVTKSIKRPIPEDAGLFYYTNYICAMRLNENS